jgi:hypothetical protein
MTLSMIKKRLSQLESKQPAGWTRVHSWDFDQYEDFLIEARKFNVKNFENVVGAIAIVPQVEELKACLQRIEDTGGYDVDIIEMVREQLQQREEEEREYLECIDESEEAY